MPKRKREDEQDNKISQIEDRAIRIKASRLQSKLEQSNKILKDALQLARGFERQKLSRRQKQAEKQPHTLLRLREEVIVVKELDPSKVAKDYLFKQLVKTKKIRESPVFVALFGENPQFEASKSVAEGNVLGRLFKANPVKEVLPDILQSIRHILAIDGGVTGGADADPIKPTETSTGKNSSTAEAEFTGVSNDDESNAAEQRDKLLEGITLDNGSASDAEVIGSGEGYDRLVASISESDGEEDRIQDSGTARSHLTKRIPTPSPSDSEDTDHQSHNQRQSSRRNTIVTNKVERTSFLPSLSMGGYYSGSESEADEGSNPDGPSGAPEQRKNRRGQRARQQIAAKKYGHNAKHLIKSKGEPPKVSKGRNSGWDPRRGAVNGSAGERFSRGSKGRSGGGATGANGDSVNAERARDRQAAHSSTKKVAGPLHPSWEAARKKKIESNNAAFAGKKITFD